MPRDLLPYDLTWSAVDPRTHPFDSATALDVVRGLDAADRVPVRPFMPKVTKAIHPDELSARYRELCHWAHSEGWDWTRAVTEELVARYGLWSTGWRWSHDEGDLGGGPVGGWCCALHSIGGPEETLARVAASLCEWREWLEFLARWFDRYPLGTLPAEDRRDAWERATAHLILQVVDRTGGGDAWYGHCGQVLTWFLTRWDVPADTAGELVDEAIGGRFRSWSGPDRKLVDSVATHLAMSLEGEPPSDPTDTGAYSYTHARTQAYLDE